MDSEATEKTNSVVAYQLRHMEESVFDVKKDIKNLNDKIDRLLDSPRWMSLEGFNREMRSVSSDMLFIRTYCEKEVKEVNERIDKNQSNIRHLSITLFTAFIAPLMILLLTYVSSKGT